MSAKAKSETVRLGGFVENPDNPSVATDEDIRRLAGKLKRVPLGLTAMRIAYVTDRTDGGCAGKRVVISGNKRLRVLKQAYGEDGEVPAEWFADVTAMSEAERHEFIVSANVSDGEFDVNKLLEQYDRTELGALMKPSELDELLALVPSGGELDALAAEGLGVDEYDRSAYGFQLTLFFDDLSQRPAIDAWLKTHDKSELSALVLKEVRHGD